MQISKRGNDGIQTKYVVLIGALLGALVFLGIYGIIPLDVTRDDWILGGYIESDLTGHYAGWVNYRNVKWEWPLGYSFQLQQPKGYYITFTDSLPIVAILCKLLSPVLPQMFQYFGWYSFLNFVLQGIAACLLLALFFKQYKIIIVSSFFFLLSPVLLERSFRHTALASQWLILFALYLFFKSRREGYSVQPGYILLGILAVGTHPYFLPMVFGIYMANLLESILNTDKVVKPLVFFAIACLATLAFGFVLGALGRGISVSGNGFGFFSMNLNALLNPISHGNINWSNFIKQYPQILGNYDGFNYLGLGVLMSIVVIVAYCVYNFFEWLLCQKKICDKPFLKTLGQTTTVQLVKRNMGLIIVCVIFMLYAISNVVTLNDIILFEIPLPTLIKKLCNIFQAGNRMFYPVLYILLLSICLFIERHVKKCAIVVLVMILIVQFADIFPALQTKYLSLREENISLVRKRVAKEIPEAWSYVMDNYDMIYFLTLNQSANQPVLTLAVELGKHGLASNYIISNRGVNGEVQADMSDTLARLLLGEPLKEKVAYILPNLEGSILKDPVLNNLSASLSLYNLGNWCLVSRTDEQFPAPSICVAVGEQLNAERPVTNVAQMMATELNDVNYDHGVYKYGNMISVYYSEARSKILRSATSLCVGDAVLTIDFVDIHPESGAIYIYTLEEVSEAFQYPQVFKVV